MQEPQTTKDLRPRVVRSLVLIALGLGIFLGYRYYNKPHRDVAAAKEDFVLSAQSLCNEFETDEAGAAQKYVGKILLVSGQIKAISLENQIQIISLDATENGAISCKMLNPVSHLQIGHRVQIKGICEGFLMDVVMSRSVVESH